jgi:hypothetical protein
MTRRYCPPLLTLLRDDASVTRCLLLPATPLIALLMPMPFLRAPCRRDADA